MAAIFQLRINVLMRGHYVWSLVLPFFFWDAVSLLDVCSYKHAPLGAVHSPLTQDMKERKNLSGNDGIHADIFIDPVTYWHKFPQAKWVIIIWGNRLIYIKYQAIIYASADLSSITPHEIKSHVFISREYIQNIFSDGPFL